MKTQARMTKEHDETLMMDDRQISQKDKLDVLRNDQRVRDTLHSRAIADIANERSGRFAAVNKPTVTGMKAATRYPKQPANSPWSGDPVPNEPSLGYVINDMETIGEKFEVEQSLASSALASADGAGARSSKRPPSGRAPTKFWRRI